MVALSRIIAVAAMFRDQEIFITGGSVRVGFYITVNLVDVGHVILFRSRRIAIYSVLSTQPWFGDGSRHTAVSTFAGIPTIPWIPGFSVFFLWSWSAVTGGLS